MLAGAVSTAEDALQLLASEHVNVILLDLEMPGMGGLGALPKMIQRASEAKILVVSSHAKDGAEATVEALSLGAADTLQKPSSGGFDQAYREVLVGKILRARPQAATPRGHCSRRRRRRPYPRCARPRASAPGCSQSAPRPAAFTRSASCSACCRAVSESRYSSRSTCRTRSTRLFATSCKTSPDCRRSAAEDGQPLLPDHIAVAPGDAHMVVVESGSGHAIKLDRRPVPSGCMPSLDPMFASLAMTHGPAALGVVLTGMGRDGTDGAFELAEAGGTLLVQNEASSAVWGMPGSIARAGLAAAILHPFDLAARIAAAAGVQTA